MLAALETLGLESLDKDERNFTLDDLQKFLVGKVQEYHNRQRIRFTFDPAASTRQSVQDILSLSREAGKEGPVAQYLIGAKLEMRFPEIEVKNDSYSTADDQLGRAGDFLMGDTSEWH